MRLAALACIFLAFVLALVTSREWPTGARFFVQALSVPGVVMTGVPLAAQLRTAWNGRQGAAGSAAVKPAAPGRAREPRDKEADRAAAVREWGFYLWVVAYALATWLLGLTWASTIFVVCYLRFAARESWPVSAVSGVAVFVFLQGLLEQVFRLSLLDGVLWHWL